MSEWTSVDGMSKGRGEKRKAEGETSKEERERMAWRGEGDLLHLALLLLCRHVFLLLGPMHTHRSEPEEQDRTRIVYTA